jgi:hypothetical protein
MLAFTLGRNRRNWELALAAVFASFAGLSRINVLPVVFLFIVYVFWQYGKKAGLITAIAGLLPLVFFHAIYWPDILKIWAYWIPPRIFPEIMAYRSPWREVFLPDDFSWWPLMGWLNDPTHLAWRGVDFFIQALRASFIAWFGAATVLLLWPRRGDWKSEQERKATVFLLVSFGFMTIFHLWAALGGKSCRFNCIAGYMLFYNFFGLAALFTAAPSFRKKHQTWRVMIVVALVFLVFLSFEFNYDSTYQQFRSFVVYDLFGAEVDLMQDQVARQQPETVAFWRFWQERFGFNRYKYFRFFRYSDLVTQVFRWLVPLLLTVFLPIVFWKILRQYLAYRGSYDHFILFFMMGFAAVFGFSQFFVQALNFETCNNSVIASHEDVGDALAEVIDPGSQIFWDIKSDMLLLYLPGRGIYLPQANYRFTMARGATADPITLQRFGWWSRPLGWEWLEEADYIVVENRQYDGFWSWDQRVENGEFNISLVTPPVESCRNPQSQIIILERIP